MFFFLKVLAAAAKWLEHDLAARLGLADRFLIIMTMTLIMLMMMLVRMIMMEFIIIMTITMTYFHQPNLILN